MEFPQAVGPGLTARGLPRRASDVGGVRRAYPGHRWVAYPVPVGFAGDLADVAARGAGVASASSQIQRSGRRGAREAGVASASSRPARSWLRESPSDGPLRNHIPVSAIWLHKGPWDGPLRNQIHLRQAHAPRPCLLLCRGKRRTSRQRPARPPPVTARRQPAGALCDPQAQALAAGLTQQPLTVTLLAKFASSYV